MLTRSSSSPLLPVVLSDRDSEYHAENCRPWFIRRRRPKLTPSCVLSPRLIAIAMSSGLGTMPSSASGRTGSPGCRAFRRGRHAMSLPSTCT